MPACTLRQPRLCLVTRNSDKKILILLIRLRTETASDTYSLSHARQARPGAHSTCLSSEAVKSVRKPKHQPLADGHDDDDKAKGGRARLCLSCNLPRPGFSHDLVIASGILRRLVELLSRRARCRVGFPAWQACETVALGVKANSLKIRHRLTHAPLKSSFDFSKPARPTPGWLPTLPAPAQQPQPSALKTAEAGPSTALQRIVWGPHSQEGTLQ